MKPYRFFKVIKMLACVALIALALGYVTMHLWNWLMPTIFGLTRITWYQAIGLLILGKLLFGGFHRHGGGGGRQEWKRHMKERWESMSEEERERFRAGMRGRGRWGCGPFDRQPKEPAETQTTR